MDVNTTIPWDNPENLISWETENLMERIKATIFIPVLYFIGAPANVVNLVLFFKQGLKVRINLCLLSLALVDLIYLTSLFSFYAERTYTQFTTGERYGTAYRFMMNKNVIGLYGFGYGPPLLSVVIAAERCVCVLFPFRAQSCISTKVLAVFILLSVSTVAFVRFAITAQYQIACFYEMCSERKSWQIYVNDYYFRHKAMLKAVDGVFYGFCISVGCPIIVLITTVITALKLQQTVRRRSHITSSSVSNKEIGVTKMLIALSVEFFVLSIPVIVLRALPMFDSQFSMEGHYTNIFKLFVSLAEVCSYTSSSVNFFVYYVTGTKYRETLHDVLGRKKTTKRLTTPKQSQ